MALVTGPCSLTSLKHRVLESDAGAGAMPMDFHVPQVSCWRTLKKHQEDVGDDYDAVAVGDEVKKVCLPVFHFVCHRKQEGGSLGVGSCQQVASEQSRADCSKLTAIFPDAMPTRNIALVIKSHRLN